MNNTPTNIQKAFLILEFVKFHFFKNRSLLFVLLLILSTTTTFLIIFPFIRTSIWYDESWRVMKLLDSDFLREINIDYSPTPYYYDLFTRLSMSLVKPLEVSFRIVNTLCGLVTASLVSAYFFKVTRNVMLSISLYFLIIFNPWYFAYIMEGKQFMFEALGFTINVIILLESAKKESFSLLQYLIFIPFFGMATYFLAASNFIMIAYVGMKRKGKMFKTSLFIFVLLLAYGLSLYYMYINRTEKAIGIVTEFFKDAFIELRLASVLSAYQGVLHLVTNPTINLLPSNIYFYYSNTLLTILLLTFALSKLFRRHLILLLLTLFFFISISMSSYFKIWPLGEIRVNIFMIPVLICLEFFAIYILVRKNKSHLAVLITTLSCLMIPLLNSTATLHKYAINQKWYKFYYLNNQIPVLSRWGDGMKECVGDMKTKLNSKSLAIVLHPMAEPLFSFELYHSEPKISKKTSKLMILRDSSEPEKIRNPAFLSSILPKHNDVYMLAMFGTLPEDITLIDKMLLRSSFILTSVKSCDSSVTVWKYSKILNNKK